MKNIFLVIILLVMVEFISAQTEISIYGGLLDYPGLSLEQKFANNLSVDISGSYRYRQGNITFADAPNVDISTNAMLTFGIKKYRTGDNGKDNFFYGGYLRYWQTSWRVESTDNLTLSQMQYADSLALTTSNTAHKISIGGLAGYKFFLGNKFTITLTGGLGFSTKKSYWSVIQEYNHPVRTYPYYSNEFLGYWNRLSGIGRLSVGYRF